MKTLLNGTSVNLIGPVGSGRGRLLEDLRHCATENRLVLYADMKSWKASYEGFLDDLGQQLGTGRKPKDLGAVIERVQRSGRSALLLLHHFDALLNNPDIHLGFGPRFFDQLNSLRNQRIALLCVTERPHDQSVVFSEGKPHGGSWLDLQQERLPALRWEELKAEIGRRLAGATGAEVTALIEAVRKEKAPYALLDFLLREPPREGERLASFRRRLRQRKRQFRANMRAGHLGAWYRRLHRVSAALRGFWIASGISRLKLSFGALLKRFLLKNPNGSPKSKDP